MRREVAWEGGAAREFDRLPAQAQEHILSALARLALDERGDVKRLQGVEGAYRLRVGEYRVVFTLEGILVVVHRVTTRGGAYRA